MIVIDFSADSGLWAVLPPICSSVQYWLDSAGLKTLMFADNLSSLLSANAAIWPVLIILLSSRVHTHMQTQNTHPKRNTRYLKDFFKAHKTGQQTKSLNVCSTVSKFMSKVLMGVSVCVCVKYSYC